MTEYQTSFMHNHDIGYARWLIETGKVNMDYQDKDGNTKLMYAVKECRLDMIKMLLEKGADMKLKNQVGDFAMYYCNHIESQEIWTLLKNNINMQNARGDTVLHMIVNTNDDNVKFLIELGADYKIVNYDGKTAYDLCKNKSLFPKTVDDIVNDAKKLDKEGIKAVINKLVAELY